MRLNVPKSVAAMVRRQKKLQKAFVDLVESATPREKVAPKPRKPAQPRLVENTSFGSNPGHLRMMTYVPPGLPPRAPLVVVLHGCGQTAKDFDDGSGWSRLARQHGFALLYPEQRSSNNPNGCFNWFRPSAVARDRGETGSIRQMIDTMVEAHGLSTDNVFIMGLSAGGALAAAALAAYPDIFKAGAVVAGLPVGGARDAMNALNIMHNGVAKAPDEWAQLVYQAAPEGRDWPRISIWQGRDDNVVHQKNADALVIQWLAVHGLLDGKAKPVAYGRSDGYVWHDEDGAIKVEYAVMDGLGHGLPIKAGEGQAMPYMLPGDLHLPSLLVESWGLDVAEGKRKVA
ncbi:extracellular catalytic domain type 1 short-chain-length polyhydroxyalkanoate depolymerase [Agrobacterium vitis]